jgi:hypothetical protein
MRRGAKPALTAHGIMETASYNIEFLLQFNIHNVRRGRA